MRSGRSRLVLAVLAALSLLAATPASAAAPGLAISVPTSVSLGEHPVTAGSIRAQLGTVTVTTSSGGLLSDSSWTAKVSTTGFAGPGQSIPPGAVSYSAGAPTALSGVNVSGCLPGPSSALSSQAVAYSCSGLSLVTGSSVSWNPTITITLPATRTVGIYTGTITHSVA